jgi:hypothetical protein
MSRRRREKIRQTVAEPLDLLSDDEVTAALDAVAQGRRGVVIHREDAPPIVNPISKLSDGEVITRLRAHMRRRGEMTAMTLEQLTERIGVAEGLMRRAARGQGRFGPHFKRQQTALLVALRAERDELLDTAQEQDPPSPVDTGTHSPHRDETGPDRHAHGGGGLLDALRDGSAD